MNRSLWSLIILFLLVTGVISLVIIKNALQEKTSRVHQSLSGKLARNNKIPLQTPTKETVQNVVELTPDKIAAMIELSLENIENNRINDAEDNIRTALIFEPDNMRALTILGRIMFARKEYIKAELIFRKQLEIDPHNATVMNNLGSSLAKQNKLAKALEFVAKANQADPESPEILLNLAGLYAMNGYPEKAIVSLKMVYHIIGPALVPLAMDQSFDNIRKEPEFINLLKYAMNQHRQNRGKNEQN